MANKKVLIALLVAVLLAFVIGRPSVEYSQDNLLQSESPEQQLSGQKAGQALPPRDINFYRQLTIGSKLALQLETDNVAEVIVTRVTREGSAVSIKGVAEAQGPNVLKPAVGSSPAEGSSSAKGFSSAKGSSLAEGSSSAKGSMVMTIGEKFIHIFLSLDSGIYEYSGKNFQGTLSRTRDMRFENDTVVLPNQSFELSDQPVRRQAVPGVEPQ